MSTVEVEDVVEPGAETAAAGTVETPGVAEVPATPAAEPAAPGPATIDWNDIGVLQQAANHLAALGYQVTQAQPEQPQAPEAPEWDPFNPQVVDARLQAAVAPLQQQIAELSNFIQGQQQAQVNDLIDNRIELAVGAAELTPAEGQTAEQLHAAVNALANTFAAQKVQALGRQPVGLEAQRLGEESIADAVAFLKGYGDSRYSAGMEAYKGELGKTSTLLDPPVNGAAIEGKQPYTSEVDVARRFMESQRSR